MAEIGQSAVLRDIFERVYAQARPRRLLVLGCTTGKDLELVDPQITQKAIGVDVNREYLEIARTKLDPQTVELVHADVLDAQLPSAQFDLIHAALLFEYVDPLSLFRRIETWLARDGVCSIVTQNPAEGVASVSQTVYSSLRSLDGHMSLHDSDRTDGFAAEAGLRRVSNWRVRLPLGKSFSVSTFRKSSAA